MTCQHVLQQLDRFLDGRLEAHEGALVEAHLGICPACRQEAEERRQLLSLLNDVAPHAIAPLPADFTGRVLQRVDGNPWAHAELIWPWLKGRWTWRQYTSAAYASATVAAAYVGLMVVVEWEHRTSGLFVLTEHLKAYLDGALSLFQ